MATVSQEGVNTLMSQINSEAQNISSAISTGGNNMLKELGQVWACPYAMDFASQFNDKMTKISQAFRANMTEFQSSVNGNVSRYNYMNQGNVSVPSVSYDDPVIDTSGVMEQLADGRQGFVERKYLSDQDSSQLFTIRADGGLFLRSSAGTGDENKIRLLSDGTQVTRTGSYTENGVETMVDGYYWDYVITPDGAKGYVARNYLRDSNGNVPGSYMKTEIERNDEEKEVNITPTATIDEIKNKLGDITITRADGSKVDSNIAKTGDIITINGEKYTLVKMGDAQGDGLINSADLLRIQKYLLGITKLEKESAYYKASDTNLDDTINSADLLKIQKYLLGVGNLNIK